MKTSKKIGKLSLLSLLGALFALASCGPTNASSSSSPEEESSSASSETKSESSSITSSSSEESSSESSLYQGDPKTFRFYCINDFHGSIVNRGDEVGLQKLFSFLKSEVDKDPEHTFVFSAGDMFQGSWESNSNYGKFITEAMNAVPFTAGALGNHDFDYGLEALKDLRDLAAFPMLGSNIYYYGTETKWEEAGSSLLVEKDGVKIGIIGTIGQGQTTSIQSNIVKDFDFIDPVPIIKEESKKLREKGAQIIVNITHNKSTSLNSFTFTGGAKPYFDGCFLGHSHQAERVIRQGVPYIQGGCNGRQYSYFELKIDELGVTYDNANYFDAPSFMEIDPVFVELENKYLDEAFYTKTNEMLANLTGTRLDSHGVARLGVKAMYEEYKSLHPDLVCTMENSQRATLYTGPFTYGELYQATPFMNHFVVAKVLGGEIKRQASYNSTYTGDYETYATLNDDTYYTCGIIDYVYYHRDTNKDFDYFPSATNPENIIHEYVDYPVDITARYLKNTLHGEINGLDFEQDSPGFCLYGR